MTVTVYFWGARGTNVGHVSMKLGNGTYISLWPRDGKLSLRSTGRTEEENRRSERSQSLDEDIANEERSYDDSIDIGGLDEDAMQRWWDNFKTRWWLLGQNCCKTVIDGLRAGGSDSRLDGFQLKFKFGTIVIWTPPEVKKYCLHVR